MAVSIPHNVIDSPTQPISLAREPAPAREPEAPESSQVGIVTATHNLAAATRDMATASRRALGGDDGKAPKGKRGVLPAWLSLLGMLLAGGGGVLGGVGVSAEVLSDDARDRLEQLEHTTAAQRAEVVALERELETMAADVQAAKDTAAAAAPATETFDRIDKAERTIVDIEIRTVVVLQVLLDGQNSMLDAQGVPDNKRPRLPPEIEAEHDAILALAGQRRRFGHSTPASGTGISGP